MHLRNENHEMKKKTWYFTTTKFGVGYQILRPTVIGIIKHETAY